MKHYIGIDLGGTNIAAGIVNEEGRIICKDSTITGQSGSIAIVKKIERLIKKMLDKTGFLLDDIETIGIGVPGTANQETGLVEYANNLGMEDEPFLGYLQDKFPDTKLVFENDANAAAYAEFRFGAGKGVKSMIMVTLGTGIGGGIILNGKMFEGINYAAGEFGHFTIKYDGLLCNCGRRGCFERYASASALVEQTKAEMKKHPESILWELCNYNEEKVEGKLLFQAVRRKDPTAKVILDTFTGYLATGMIDLVNIFQPEMICIGGGISKAGSLLIDPICEKMKVESYTRMSKRQPKIVTAKLGNDAGIIGSALMMPEKYCKM